MPSDSPEGLTPREALDRIAALCDKRAAATHGGMRPVLDVEDVRAVLAEVSPEPGGATSDDHQRGYAQGYTEGRAAGWDERGEAGGVLDRDQARAVQLDRREPREAAAAIAAQILGRQRTGPLSDEDLGRYVADSVLAAVVHPPVAGVVLSPGEVRTAAQAVRQLRGSSFSGDPNLLVALRALAARLEAGASS